MQHFWTAGVQRPLTLLTAVTPHFLQSVFPVVQLHAKSTAQGGGGLRIRDVHHIDVTVCGAEVAAVERRHLGLGLLEGRPRSVLQYPGKLARRTKETTVTNEGVNQPK